MDDGQTKIEIQVKTAGQLGEYLPPGSGRNTAQLMVPAGTTAAGLIAWLGMPTDQRYLVSVNGAVVPTGERDACVIEAGDRVAIMPPLRGG